MRSGVEPDYVAALVERFGVDATRRIGELSKSNKQKVGVIQAFMHRPRC